MYCCKRYRLARFKAFSIALYESTDLLDTAQLGGVDKFVVTGGMNNWP